MLLGGAYSFGDAGKLILNVSYSDIDDKNANIGFDKNGALNDDNTLTESDLIYKVKVGEVNMLAAWVHQEFDNDIYTADGGNGMGNRDILRVWGRYNF